MLRGHADAGIAHNQPDAACVRVWTSDHLDLAGLGEFHGVRDQIIGDLRYPQRITEAQDTVTLPDRDAEIQTLALGGGFIERLGALGQGGKAKGRLLQLDPPRLDLREIENVVQKMHQCVAGLDDDFQLAVGVIGQVLAAKDAGHAEYAIHGRADFMAHIGEEFRLGPIGRIGAHAGFHQVGDVGDRTSHAHRCAVVAALGQTADAEPAVVAILAPEPGLGVVFRSCAQVGAHRLHRGDTVVRVQAFGKGGRIGDHGFLWPAQHLAQARGVVELVPRDVPVPETVGGAAYG